MRPRFAGLVLLALLTTACATAYAPKNATGGYVEKWRSPTELEVFFHHNDLLTVEDARFHGPSPKSRSRVQSGQYSSPLKA